MSFNNPFRKLETIAAAGLAALGATEAQANATEGDMAEALRANVAGHETVLQAGAPEVIRANVARDANGLPLVNPLKGDFVSQPHSDKLPLKGPQE